MNEASCEETCQHWPAPNSMWSWLAGESAARQSPGMRRSEATLWPWSSEETSGSHLSELFESGPRRHPLPARSRCAAGPGVIAGTNGAAANRAPSRSAPSCGDPTFGHAWRGGAASMASTPTGNLHNGRLKQLTRDQTTGEFMVNVGAWTEEQARNAPTASTLASALGADDLTVAVGLVDLQPGDTLLLCSDGLTRHVADERIAQVLGRAADAQSACRELVADALDGGGSDNITVVVARTQGLRANRPVPGARHVTATEVLPRLTLPAPPPAAPDRPAPQPHEIGARGRRDARHRRRTGRDRPPAPDPPSARRCAPGSAFRPRRGGSSPGRQANGRKSPPLRGPDPEPPPVQPA